MNQEFLKKYGVWIAAGLVAVYLVLRRSGGGTAAQRPGIDPELAREELRQRGQAGERADRTALEEARLRAQLEAERIRQETERIRLGLQREGLEAQQRAARAAQQAGLLSSILGTLGKILGGSGGGSGSRAPSVSTPPTFPRTTGSTSPGTTVPFPAGIEPFVSDPFFQPEFPTPNFSATFQAPDLSFDSGYSFANQNFYEAQSQAEFDYYNSLEPFGQGELTGVYPEDSYYSSPGYDYFGDAGYDFGGGFYEASSQAEFDYYNSLEPTGGYTDFGGGDYYYPEYYGGGGGGGSYSDLAFADFYDYYE